MQVLLAGKVNVPKIYCLKELKVERFPGQKIIPIALKNGQNFQMQRFRIPFRMLGDQEYEVEF